MAEIPTVTSIMTRTIISIGPEALIAEAARIMNENKFNGLPVVDVNNVLVGIVTEYDLIGGEEGIHLPTLQTVLTNLPVMHKDRSTFQQDIEAVSKLTVKDIMNPEPLTLPDTATIEEVVKTFREHHRVNPIPVINAQKHVVGVVSRYDVLKGLPLIFTK